MSTVGDLYAERQGYFRQNGLKVDVKPGGPEHDALKELELGHAQFGVASADQVLRAGQGVAWSSSWPSSSRSTRCTGSTGQTAPRSPVQRT